MNTEGSTQRVNLTDAPLLAQDKNSENRSTQPADTKSLSSLEIITCPLAKQTASAQAVIGPLTKPPFPF
jgi:hypothetical protein